MKHFLTRLLVVLTTLCGSLILSADPTVALGATNEQHTDATQNGAVNAATLIGVDIGVKINTYLAANSASGRLFIPQGLYSYSTPIAIKQAVGQHLEIECADRATVLNFTGSGDAVFVTSSTSPNASLRISNCTINGSTAVAGSNGIHAYDYQNLYLDNVAVTGFPGVNVLGEGLLDSVIFKGDLFQAGTYNLELKPDPTHSIGSNGNRVYSGSMQYAGLANFFDAGNSSVYGGDTSNSLHGVTLEMSKNRPQFIVEGTWNDSIEDCYIEYIGFPTSTANLYSGIVGNYAGSGMGSNVTRSANAFRFEGNYLITPAKGASFTTASLLLANSMYATINTLNDQGAPTYGIVFYSSGTNQYVSTSNLNIKWQTAEYLNPPQYSSLWNINGQPLTATQFNWNAAGVSFGGMVQSAGLQVSNSVVAATGMQHKRTKFSCGTGTLCTVQVKWSVPFADGNYTTACSIALVSGSSNINATVWIGAETGSGFTAQVYVNGALSIPAGSTLGCIGMHD